MIARIPPIEQTSMLSAVNANVYRNDLMPAGKTGGISVQAVDQDLLAVLGGSVADGVWFDDAKAAYPNVVLGSVAAERLGDSGGQRGAAGLAWGTLVHRDRDPQLV